MPENTDQPLNSKFRQIFDTVAIANMLTSPLTGAIHDLLETSAANIKSDEASVLIRDGSEGDLQFLTVIGKVADQLTGMKVPAGKGIAGFVLSSGQPMAVADVGEEENFYAEMDKTTGYSTQMLLATPLRHGGEIIGVLEYVNRRGEPPYAAFTPAEMDQAAIYADALGSLVYAYESAKLLHELSEKLFTSDENTGLDDIREWLAAVRDSEDHRERMELAVMLRELSSRGEAERMLCKELLETILKYANDKNETKFLNY